MFPLCKPVVGQNIALHAVPAYRASVYLVSVFTTHLSFYFIFSKFLQSSRVESVLSSESEFLLVLEYILFHPDMMTLHG